MTGPKLRMAGTFITVPAAFVALCMIPDAKGMAVLVWFAITVAVTCLAFYCTQWDENELDWMLSRKEWKEVKAKRKAARQPAPSCEPQNCGSRGLSGGWW